MCAKWQKSHPWPNINYQLTDSGNIVSDTPNLCSGLFKWKARIDEAGNVLWKFENHESNNNSFNVRIRY